MRLPRLRRPTERKPPFPVTPPLNTERQVLFGNITPTDNPIEDMWVGIVHGDNGGEALLLWRVTTEIGDALIPVVAHSEEGIEVWESQMAAEINMMEGPPLSWRHFPAGEFVSWLRRSTDPSTPESER